MSRTTGLRAYTTRAAVAITMAVALLSLVTGVLNIGTAGYAGPLSGVVPRPAQRAAGFTGTLTGFLTMASALGLRRGFRAAWRSTVVLLPLTAVQGLVQWSPLSVPLVLLSGVALPTVLSQRDQFDRRLALTTTQLAAGVAVIGTQAYGTVGTYALRRDFREVTTLADAFYFTLVTASTVGYGDAAPTSQAARLFVMSLVVVGTASFAIALGTLLGPAIEARVARVLGRMTESQLELLDDHVLVLGYGDLTEAVLDELRGVAEFVIVTPDPDHATELSDRGDSVIVADPGDEEALERARIGNARAVVVATNDDAEDALAVLTARKLVPDVRIVAAATRAENVEKLRSAGADAVISPALIGGRLLVREALGERDGEELVRRLLGETDDAAEE